MSVSSLKTSVLSLLPPAALGCLIGFLTFYDPVLTWLFTNFNIVIKDVNIFNLFPYEISLLVFLIPIVLFFVARLFTIIARQFEKSAILIIIIAAQTISITKVGLVDGSNLAIVMFFILFLLKMMVKNEKFHFTFLDVINILLVSLLFLSCINTGLKSINQLIRTSLATKAMMLSFLMQNLIYKKKLDNFFIKWLIIITVISSIIAIFQEIIWVTLHTLIIGFKEEKQIRFTMEVTSFGTALRVPAFAPGYKLFAFYIIVCIAIIFNYLLYKKTLEKKTKIYLYTALCLLSSALLLTFSTDSLLVLGIGICLSVLFRWPKYGIHFAAATMVLILLVYITPLWEYIGRKLYTEISWGEYRIRVQLAREGIHGFLNGYTWLGSSIKNGHMYTSHFFRWPAHSAIILSADEVGVFGLFTYLAAVGYTIISLFSINLPANNENFMIARGMLIGFITLFILLQSHAGWLETILWMYMGASQGLVLTARDAAQRRYAPD